MNNKLLVSLITPVLNGSKTIETSIKSVLGQTYDYIEYIVVDNGSTDGTMDIINRHKDKIAKIVFEKERGIYTTMNRGLRFASGDIVGILNSDDFYAHNKVIEKVVNIFLREEVDSCYADLEYVSRDNPQKVIRFWKGSQYIKGKFNYGWMPPHPTFFVKRSVYAKLGYFNTDLKISADYELMLRFLVRYGISTYYIPEVLVKMRAGGISNQSLKNLLTKTYEDWQAWKINNLNTHLYIILLKKLLKLPQFFKANYRLGLELKRVFDFLFALCGLFISFPLWSIFGLGIWLEDGKQVFYSQERVGKDGLIFKGIKFRSMIHDAEKSLGPVQSQEKDLRVTRTGRLLRATAMDELPQLWNILKGEMSFVGPRALRPVEAEVVDGSPRSLWEFPGFKERSSVRPGLTGIAQVFAPRDIPRNQKFKYDIWYVRNQNFWLDIRLIMSSFLITFRGRWEARNKKLKSLDFYGIL